MLSVIGLNGLYFDTWTGSQTNSFHKVVLRPVFLFIYILVALKAFVVLYLYNICFAVLVEKGMGSSQDPTMEGMIAQTAGNVAVLISTCIPLHPAARMML